MTDTTPCPECGLPAEVTERFVLGSSDAPVEHLRVVCVARHWFLMTTEMLARILGQRPAVAPPGDHVHLAR